MTSTITADDLNDEAAPLGLLARAALAVVAGLLLAASYALHPLWWAAWLAPVPLILSASETARRARFAGVIAGVAAVGGLLSYYVEMNGAAVVLLILLLRIASLVFALRLTQAAARSLPLGLAMLILPVSFAGLEQISMTVSVHGAAGSLAYSQMDMPALVQAAALGGVPAVVFVTLLPGTLAALFLLRRWPSSQQVGAVAALAVAALAIALFSAVQLRPERGTVPTTLIATDRFDAIPRDWRAVWAAYAPTVRTARGGLVVLPEKIALLDRAGAAEAARDVSAAATATGATIVVGIEVRDGVYRNRALVASPDGRVAWYDKQRLVPGFEDRDVPGTSPLVVGAAGTRVGVAICKDMHIPSIGREYARATGLMAVPAWDFGRDGWMGARMTALRAVENGYAVARSARNGFVGAYDSAGRTIAERATTPGMTVLRTTIPAISRPTLYARIGDLFGWSCVAMLGLFLAVGARHRLAARR